VSLREFPPGQEEKNRRGRFERLRYLPLIVLLIASVTLALGGVAVNLRVSNRPVAAITPYRPVDPAPITSSNGRASLPQLCHPAVAPPAKESWIGGDSAKAEAVWDKNYALMGSSPIVRGLNGQVDWNDAQANNLSQVVGREILSKAQARRWDEYFSAVQTSLAQQGIPFYIVVAPSKFDVYPHELPVWAQSIRGSESIDQLIAQYPQLPIVDLRAPLRQASETNSVYSRVNSHWTDYGAYVGWTSIEACINATSPSLGSVTPLPISSVGIGAEHNEFAPYGVTNHVPDWAVPLYSSALNPVMVTASGKTSTVDGETPTGLLSLPATTSTHGALVDKSALVLRDSFGDSLSVPLQQTFERTWQFRHNLDGAVGTQPNILQLTSKYHPDVVVFEMAERYLQFPPLAK